MRLRMMQRNLFRCLNTVKSACATLYGKCKRRLTLSASICLIMMNFSTDDRAVSTSRAWLKRILISWVILNVLGFVMTYMVDLTSGGQYIPNRQNRNQHSIRIQDSNK